MRQIALAFICLSSSAGSFQAGVQGRADVSLLLLALALLALVMALAPKGWRPE